MATDKEPFQSLKGIAEQLAEHSLEKAQGAMKNYFGWLQSAMSATPWGSTDLNKKLLEYAAENSSAAFGYVQNLTRAKNWEDVVRIQTAIEFAQRAGKEHRRRIYQIGRCCDQDVRRHVDMIRHITQYRYYDSLL